MKNPKPEIRNPQSRFQNLQVVAASPPSAALFGLELQNGDALPSHRYGLLREPPQAILSPKTGGSPPQGAVSSFEFRVSTFFRPSSFALACVTRRDGENYTAFVERAKSNGIARRVKPADLEDNMDLRRLSDVTARDRHRLAKYLKAYWHLLESDHNRVTNVDPLPDSVLKRLYADPARP